MLSSEERAEIREEVYRDLAEVEDDIAHRAGSYTYYCAIGGLTVFSHHPIGRILRRL